LISLEKGELPLALPIGIRHKDMVLAIRSGGGECHIPTIWRPTRVLIIALVLSNSAEIASV
jgi:hypothetical protein